MPTSALYFIKRFVEFQDKDLIRHVPRNTRGIYVLLKQDAKQRSFDVVYIGMARGMKAGIGSRLLRHKQKKNKYWTHFSIFEVHDNIRKEDIEELEGLFRQIYSKDSAANKLNKQRRFKKFRTVKTKSITTWRKE